MSDNVPSIVETVKVGDIIANKIPIVWVNGDIVNGDPILLPQKVFLKVILVLDKGEEDQRVLLQIVDYYIGDNPNFFRRRRLPEFAVGSWGASCFKKNN